MKVDSVQNIEGYMYIIKIWQCPDLELNQGHRDFQPPALPTELSGQYTILYYTVILFFRQ